uniref:MD-2-related lipid-recognition domain-containing protein n=1 Tax=Amphimedon queenslandica TaxID=400682 RepID=A0A1X7TP36_AMPQE
MGRLVEYILLLLSVVLVVSTLTGSTNNYYNAVTKKFSKLINDSFTPYPLIPGKNYNVQGTILINKTVEWGTIHFTLAHNFRNTVNITFVNEKLNLCDFIVDLLKLHCPVPPGIYQFNYTDTVPKLFWPGRYYGKAAVYNEEGEELMCQTIDVNINE